MSTAPVSWSGADSYDPSCGGFRNLFPGYNVSLSFVGKQVMPRALSNWVFAAHRAPGVSVVVDFFGEETSHMAEVTLDGESVAQVNIQTNISSASADCVASAVSWSSGLLSLGNHTIAIIPPVTSDPLIESSSVGIRDFVYVHISQILELVQTNSSLPCNRIPLGITKQHPL
jgi:hypothetical protein